MYDFALPVRVGLFVMMACLVGCVVTTSAPDPSPNDDGAGDAPAGSSQATSGSPMRVVVDTDQVMEADPGKGVGVFVEYATGGQWHVWWTCDTALSSRSCRFDVRVSSPAGITKGESTATIAAATETSLGLRSTTSTTVDGVKLTTAPGAVLTVEASVDGVTDSSFIFFVQKGQVNGGYQGGLTNPLELQGNSP